MSEGFDIQNLLQTGYFKSSRANKAGQPFVSPYPTSVSCRHGDGVTDTKFIHRISPGGSILPEEFLSHPAPAHSDEPLQTMALRGRLVRKSRQPPPPSVEDEEVSLAREYGPSKFDHDEEEPHSRGDLEQYPVIMEVHEHNPERRFVIIDNPAPKSGETSGDDHGEKKRTKTPSSSRPTTPNHDRSPQERSPSRKTPQTQEASTASRRRKSRVDLPPVDTTWGDETARHQRTQSAASSRPPEYFTPRGSRQFGESLLSPEVVQHGGKRDRIISGYGQPPRAADGGNPRVSQPNLPDDRRRDSSYQRRSPSPGPGKRSTSNVESSRPRRRLSVNQEQDPKYRDGRYSASSSVHSKERTRDSTRSGEERLKAEPPTRSPRDENRSGDEKSLPNKAPETRRPKSIVTQEEYRGDHDYPPAQGGGYDDKPSLAKSSTIPPGPRKPGVQAGDLRGPRSSATFSINMDERKSRNRQENALPYPDDEPQSARPRTPQKATDWPDLARPKAGPSGPRPVPSSAAPNGPRPVPSATSSTTGRTAATAAAAAAAATVPSLVHTTSNQSQGHADERTWQLPTFDPEQDGVKINVPVGAFRRFSEGRDSAGPPAFPPCPRTKPVAGKMDWLTLPRTDFNICLTCYEAVFSNTKYRTEFSPMLRPTDQPLVCNFGTSPWYRIALLIAWHQDAPDLRIFHQIANIASSVKAEACPGTKKSNRKWYTVWDPADGQPIEEFPVCYQCVKTVEALLPNLTGVFSPLPPRSESSSWRTCELHFTPDRKRFVLYFDILERASEKATSKNQKAPILEMAKELEKLSLVSECREDSPIPEAHWHVMQFLPQFTVCGDCFEDVVRPKLDIGNVVACNFFNKQKQLPLAACQLYSRRMRDVFARACRKKDHTYLEEKVKERLQVEADIHAKLVKLDRGGQDEAWAEEQVAKLVQEWKRWE